MLQRKLAPALMAITVALFVVLPMDAGAGKRNHRGQARIHHTHPQVLAHISELADERARATKAIEAGELKYTDEGLVLA